MGTLAYLADYDAGLQILDVSNPARPLRVGGFDTRGFAMGVQVVGNRGIGSPLREVAFELLTGLGGSDDDYEFSASWLLGQPRPIKLDKVTKLIKKEGDHRYKIEAVDVLF